MSAAGRVRDGMEGIYESRRVMGVCEGVYGVSSGESSGVKAVMRGDRSRESSTLATSETPGWSTVLSAGVARGRRVALRRFR